MRLIRLQLAAVGPFAGSHSIDLEQLGSSGLFLLEGPTGAGKSTLIDAVVYALYGEVAGTGSSSDRIRSDFADPRSETYVDLVFETRSGLFRVRRTPAYERVKLRGSGTTKEQASARLWRYTSPTALEALRRGEDVGGEIVSTRIPEVAGEVVRAVGLTREQFTQTVVLPQGEFARFLTADTEARQKVLERVFGTEVYSRMEVQLAQMRVAARRALAEADQFLETRVAAFTEAAALDDDGMAALDAARRGGTAGGGFDGDALSETARGIAAERDEAARSARTEAESARTGAEEADTAARTAQERLENRRRRLELESERERLEAGRPEQARRRDQLDRHRRAQPILTAAARSAAAQRRVREAEEAERTALEQLRTAAAASGGHGLGVTEAGRDAMEADGAAADPDIPVEAAAGGADAEFARAGAMRDAATERLGSLAPLEETEKRLPGRRRDHEALAERIRTARTEATRIGTELEKRPAERTALTERRGELATAAALLTDRTSAAERAEAALTAARQVARLDTQMADAAATRDGCVKTAREAVEHERELRHRRVAGMAGELALTLTAGEPCPVCGATDHPAPAERGTDPVDQDRIDAAETARRAAEEALSTAATTLATLTDRRDRAAQDAGGADVAAATRARDAAKEAAAAARDAGVAAEDLAERITAHDAETARLGARRAELTAQIESLRERHAADASNLAAEEKAVADALGGEATSIAALAQRLRTLRDRAAALQTARDNTREATRQRTAASAELDRTVEEQSRDGDLADATAARAARLSDDAAAGLEKAMAEHEAAVAATARRLAEPAVRDATGDVDELVAALDAARTRLRDARAVSDAATGRAARARAVAERTRESAGRIRDALDDQAGVRAQAEPVIRMADLATGNLAGDGGDRVRLSSFVLMRRLDQVVAAANDRLRVLSSGRLALERSLSAASRKRGGLDLVIRDYETDSVRAPATLSGGERFYVSLCLALGLADIVTAEAGGVQLETLFVDEGFGSLDPERLDLVLAELGRLGGNGRTVGVVSHVAEMKARIPERIEVRRTGSHGSTLQVIA